MSNISKDALLKAFPHALSGDGAMVALASVSAKEMTELYEEADLTLIYSQIDLLDESVLDILAYDFKIDWWDANASIEVKRAVLKNSFFTHRKMGTAHAVKNAIRDNYGGTEIKEWFEYGGQPYHYKVEIDLGDSLYNADILCDIVKRVNIYGNVRSKLEQLTFHAKGQKKLYAGTAITVGEIATLKVDGSS